MKFKRIFVILLLMVIFSTISLASATQEDVAGIKFEMIDGFIQNGLNITMGATSEEVVTFTKGSEDIIINVSSSMDENAFYDSFHHFKEKTIGNKTGYFDENTHTFHYIDSSKVVSITVPDDSYLEKLIG